ncbi:MAG: rRNA maturation RNase YbeY [Anaerolineales bacterium]|nr:rRNA maturation RNase YbeY [Anaerolineales bacterium]
MSENELINVEIADPFQRDVREEDLVRSIQAALTTVEIDDQPALSVLLTGDQQIREFNSRYRGVDKATDVLAFPTDFEDPDLETRYLGDLIISVPRARQGARDRGHQLGEELQLLVIHGVLHLAGYDHQTQEGKKTMWSLQEQILSRLGLEIQVEG